MARLGVNEIRVQAKEILKGHRSGMRFTALVNAQRNAHPETNTNTIYTQVSELVKQCPEEVFRPSRGIYQLKEFAEGAGPEAAAQAQPVLDRRVEVPEADFYASFAAWLVDDLEEATISRPLGGAGQRTKWGTPDVVGTYKPLPDYVYKFPTEIVVAEIKIDPTQSVVAFGQAIAYRLFAHKSYLVMPNTLGEDEQGRLEALAVIFGLGLVLFDVDRDNPNYVIRCRAQRFDPDVFYINEFIQRLAASNRGIFTELFG